MTTSYYKATRPDGRDYHTGQLDYAAALRQGRTVRHPTSRKITDQDPRTFLALAETPGAALHAGNWPVRLFRVEAAEAVPFRGEPNLQATLALSVVEEVSPQLALGPGGEAALTLIERAAALSPEQVEHIVSLRGPSAPMAEAVLATHRAARKTGRNHAVSALSASLFRRLSETQKPAYGAARNALVATLLHDLLDPEVHATLLAHWVAVTEEN